MTTTGKSRTLEGILRNKDGKIIPCFANAAQILRHVPGLLSYDSLANTVILQRSVPDPRASGADQAPLPFEPRPIEDGDVLRLQEFLQLGWMPSLPKGMVYDAILSVARANSFHPISDWLHGLKWDEVPRLDSWLTTYLGACVDTTFTINYLSAVGRMFLISMVARVEQPGCQADYMLILEGGQGREKSKACRVLASDSWFSDNLPDLHSKDASQHLRGKWLIEVAELETMNRADTALMKKYVTRREEIYRPPYGRVEAHEPRQCIFIGTTNEDSYLKDVTGGRRFWPVICGGVDIERLRRDRDQLFAEAFALYQRNVSWWPDPEFEDKVIRPVQVSRQNRDIWTDPIRAWLDGRASESPIRLGYSYSESVPDHLRGNVYKRKITAWQIASYCLWMSSGMITKSAQGRIIDILKQLGWIKRNTLSDGRSVWLRNKPSTAPKKKPSIYD